MKKIICIIASLILMLSFPAFSALYEREDNSENPIYSLAQLNAMVGYLEEYYGDCTAIFKAEGKKIDLCTVTLSFTRAVEVRAINKIIDNPTISENDWRDELFVTYLNNFPSSEWANMFKGLSQSQFNLLLNKIIYWNPLPYDEERTFEQLKIAIEEDEL